MATNRAITSLHDVKLCLAHNRSGVEHLGVCSNQRLIAGRSGLRAKGRRKLPDDRFIVGHFGSLVERGAQFLGIVELFLTPRAFFALHVELRAGFRPRLLRSLIRRRRNIDSAARRRRGLRRVSYNRVVCPPIFSLRRHYLGSMWT